MIIDRSKGYFISKNDMCHPNVSYVDDLAYYLYIIDTGFQPRFTQVGFRIVHEILQKTTNN
ncbi:MAG: hypothetical protein ACOC2U_03735 [bacterium]